MSEYDSIFKIKKTTLYRKNSHNLKRAILNRNFCLVLCRDATDSASIPKAFGRNDVYFWCFYFYEKAIRVLSNYLNNKKSAQSTESAKVRIPFTCHIDIHSLQIQHSFILANIQDQTFQITLIHSSQHTRPNLSNN